MITGKTQPLQLAARILTPENLDMFRQQPFNSYGWTILDRWAVQEPEALKALQEQGEIVLFDRVLQQQELEQETILNNKEARDKGLTPMEVLAMEGIPTQLAAGA